MGPREGGRRNGAGELGEVCEKEEAVMEVGSGTREDEKRGVPQRDNEAGSQEDGVEGEVKSKCLPWLAVILQGALCHLFQRLALEGDRSNIDLTHQVKFTNACTYIVHVLARCCFCVPNVMFCVLFLWTSELK